MKYLCAEPFVKLAHLRLRGEIASDENLFGRFMAEGVSYPYQVLGQVNPDLVFRSFDLACDSREVLQATIAENSWKGGIQRISIELSPCRGTKEEQVRGLLADPKRIILKVWYGDSWIPKDELNASRRGTGHSGGCDADSIGREERIQALQRFYERSFENGSSQI